MLESTSAVKKSAVARTGLRMAACPLDVERKVVARQTQWQIAQSTPLRHYGILGSIGRAG